MKFFYSRSFEFPAKILLAFALFFMLRRADVLFAQAPDSWIQKANLLGPARERAVGISINGMRYVGTGWNLSTYYKDWWQYNPATDTWTQKADFGFLVGGTARNRAIGLSINGKGYVGTGWDGTNYLQKWYEYDPGSNAWTQKTDFPGGARYSASAFTVG